MARAKGTVGVLSFVAVALVIVVAVIGLQFLGFQSNVVKDVDESSDRHLADFVQCLNETNAKIYGFNNSAAVKRQLMMFGAYVGDLNYIDCEIQREKCMGLVVYPTWEIRGRVVPGSLSLDVLSKLSGCDLKN